MDELRWNALAMYPAPASARRPASGPPHGRPDEATRTDAAVAKAVLDRIVIPPEVVDRINELVTPGSSLIVSDEAASRETGKGTDFVVVMSGEPQGGIRRRRLRSDVFSVARLPAPPPSAGVFGPGSAW
jgi:hypothetical protein